MKKTINKKTAKQLQKLVNDIYEYEEGDTGDIPGYYLQEGLNFLANDILELLGFERFDF
jgi:hypothetical protein